MKHLGLIALVLGGCFYTDPINQRPSLEIVNTSGAGIGRGQKDVTLQAITDDPEGQFVRLHWRLYSCLDAADFATCDQAPAKESSNETFVFDAPVKRDDPDGTGPMQADPAESLRIELEGTDDLGATARPSQQLFIPLGDGRPTLDIQHTSNYQHTINTPIDVFTVFKDPDDSVDTLTVGYTLFAPALSNVQLVDLCTAADPAFPDCFKPTDFPVSKEQGRRFIPDRIGEWKVEVTVVDPVGAPDGSTTTTHSVQIAADQVPCLGAMSPLAPPVGSTIPLSDPTLFQIHNVADALDPYPSNTNDPILAQSQFHWSIKVGAGPRQLIDTEAGNTFAFDPATFVPGDIVEVRAEIADRTNPFPTPSCDVTQLTCALDTTQPTCIQRQTWMVEIR